MSGDAARKGEEMDNKPGNTELDRERWQHAACLSIAEGVPGWKEETWAESEAIRAVRKLRIRMMSTTSQRSSGNESTDAARKLAEVHMTCPCAEVEERAYICCQESDNSCCEHCGFPSHTRSMPCKWPGHAAIDTAVSAAREEERAECQRIPVQIRMSPEAMSRFADNFKKHRSIGNAIAYVLIECEGLILKRRSDGRTMDQAVQETQESGGPLSTNEGRR